MASTIHTSTFLTATKPWPIFLLHELPTSPGLHCAPRPHLNGQKERATHSDTVCGRKRSIPTTAKSPQPSPPSAGKPGEASVFGDPAAHHGSAAASAAALAALRVHLAPHSSPPPSPLHGSVNKTNIFWGGDEGKRKLQYLNSRLLKFISSV